MADSVQSEELSRGRAMRVRDVPGRSILRLKSWTSVLGQVDLRMRIAGLDLPQEVGAIDVGELRALCTGPSDWLLVAPGLLSLPARGAIEADSVRQGLALVDLSSGLSVLEVSGPATRDVLAKGCGLDLDPQVFVPGGGARTRLAQIPVVIDFVQAPDRFELYVARSLTGYLREWLCDAVREFH